MRYALKIKSNPDNAVYDSIFKRPYRHLYEHTDFKSLGESISILFREADINTGNIMTSEVPDIPIWDSEPNEVSFDLSIYDKSSTSPELFRSKFSEILHNYKDCGHIYTDGSKQNEKAAFGMTCQRVSLSDRIEDDSSIFTAELEAIDAALDLISDFKDHKKFVIFSDSRSALQSIDNQISRNPLVIYILDRLQLLKNDGFFIKFCWIPSHVVSREMKEPIKKLKQR